MSDGRLIRLFVVLAGVAFGAVTTVAVALAIWVLPTRGDATGDARAAGSASVAGAPLAQVATPTPPPDAVQVAGLAELERRAPELRGQMVRVTIDEQELSQLAADNLERRLPEGAEVTDVQTELRPGEVILSGIARRGAISSGFRVTGEPTVVGDNIELRVTSAEPDALAQLAGIVLGDTLTISIPNLQARSVDVVDGQVIVTGVVP